MAQQFVNSFRGRIRGHLSDVSITIGQLLHYQATHGDRLPPLLLPGEVSAFQAVQSACNTKLAQKSPKA